MFKRRYLEWAIANSKSLVVVDSVVCECSTLPVTRRSLSGSNIDILDRLRKV